MTRETVFFDTLARRAMSLMVARRPSDRRVVGTAARLAGAAGSGASARGRRALAGLAFAGGFAMSRGLFGFVGGLRAPAAVYGAPGLDKRRCGHFNDTGFHRGNEQRRPPAQTLSFAHVQD